MGYVDGESLSERLQGGPLEPDKAAEVVLLLAQAVEYAHQHGVIHRDLKPSRLETICLKCLSKRPEQRYATAGELSKDLRRYLDGEAIHARPTNAAQRMVRWARRYPGFTVVLVPLTILYAYHLIVAFGLNRLESREPFFHWFATGLVVAWLSGAWIFQQLMLRAPYRRWIGFAWSTMDVVFLTSYLFVASRDKLSPNYIAYIGLVAASAIRFRIGVQYYTTALCAIAYLVFVWKGTPNQPPQFPETIFHVVPFLVQLLVIGLIQVLLLRRIRRVDRLKLREES